MTADLPAALLWDFDGTTVDSEGSWERAELRWLAQLGGPRSGVELDRKPGASLDGTIDWLHAAAGVPVGDRAAVRKALCDLAIQEYLADGPVVLPGVRELMAQAEQAGVPNLLVSANETWLLREILSGWGRVPYAHLVGEDQVARSKPAPDLYLEAARLLGVDPARCLAFEDSVTGATAAVTAGCCTVGVTGQDTASVAGVALRVDGLADVGFDELVDTWRRWTSAP
ncbi:MULTISPECIES: HAD family hydrolase [unclassified Luteococcus]|uniref:HAD family hydrolase n=1 Tax=unclassified Luteococcus TaxID=2639923 RepID=UPI00313C3CC3